MGFHLFFAHSAPPLSFSAPPLSSLLFFPLFRFLPEISLLFLYYTLEEVPSPSTALKRLESTEGNKEDRLLTGIIVFHFCSLQVSDMSLVDYIAVAPVKHATFIPHTAGRYSIKRFRKAQCPIVERLTNSLMMHGRNNGKKLMAVRIVKHAMEIIHLLTDLNPIQVIVDAVINSGPREDATRIGSAGVVRRQAVDISPLRRVNQAVYLLTTGARESAFRNIKTIAECLADELINAAKGSSNSYAIKKKDEIERVAKANR
ncbi:40S ribosomal protein S5-like [Dioscorea cayenensis subsp. rotundata]|uniref:Small ribosomal subunit protein uS7c n=1 Tax=Dioscorea cayennensis subsp. rotundata TaxID=55577 RepID=A0AB40C0M2_DIOCR|nr:40S ribosomal protein S5-like [Dioscorea cayenensis subsp. rotundata]